MTKFLTTTHHIDSYRPYSPLPRRPSLPANRDRPNRSTAPPRPIHPAPTPKTDNTITSFTSERQLPVIAGDGRRAGRAHPHGPPDSAERGTGAMSGSARSCGTGSGSTASGGRGFPRATRGQTGWQSLMPSSCTASPIREASLRCTRTGSPTRRSRNS